MSEVTLKMNDKQGGQTSKVTFLRFLKVASFLTLDDDFFLRIFGADLRSLVAAAAPSQGIT